MWINLNISHWIRRLVFGDCVVGSPPTSLRNVVAWLFIALVAAFLTQPSGEPGGMAETPVPWPAELGLDGNPGI